MKTRSHLARFVLQEVAGEIEATMPSTAHVMREELQRSDDFVEEAMLGYTTWLEDPWRSLVGMAARALSPPPTGIIVPALAVDGLRRLSALADSAPELWASGVAERVQEAARLAAEDDFTGALGALGPTESRRVAEPLHAITEEIVAVLRGAAVSHGPLLRAIRNVTAQLTSGNAPRRDAARGRRDRAALVLAVLQARNVELFDINSGHRWWLTSTDARLPLVESLLLDPAWDDIDHSAQQEGVVHAILRGQPSPVIRIGDREVAIRGLRL